MSVGLCPGTSSHICSFMSNARLICLKSQYARRRHRHPSVRSLYFFINFFFALSSATPQLRADERSLHRLPVS
jgi:hypothetical protein